jgi:hypothetical protein
MEFKSEKYGLKKHIRDLEDSKASLRGRLTCCTESPKSGEKRRRKPNVKQNEPAPPPPSPRSQGGKGLSMGMKPPRAEEEHRSLPEINNPNY